MRRMRMTIRYGKAAAAGMLLAVCLPGVASAADKAAKRAEKQAERQAAKEAAQESNKQARAAQQALNAPRVLRLEQMSPEEREAALAKLPPDWKLAPSTCHFASTRKAVPR